MGRKRRTQRVQTGADLDRTKAEDKICNLGEMQGAAPFFSLSW